MAQHLLLVCGCFLASLQRDQREDEAEQSEEMARKDKGNWSQEEKQDSQHFPCLQELLGTA